MRCVLLWQGEGKGEMAVVRPKSLKETGKAKKEEEEEERVTKKSKTQK